MEIDRSSADPLWYKDAVIYELHVKTFFDSNGDGVGDFRGLIEKLDYIQTLGVTCIWLLPFYPSPLHDDGYDIADYFDVASRYGTLADFEAFIDQAHHRGLKVITELVVNHTSIEHPWFQRAKQSAPDSSERHFYVWSSDDKRYSQVRIIFSDAEKSNWTWDDEVGAFYWHRFFHHQPDLNFDNPDVIRAVKDVMHFWLDRGVDGFRLDAVAYLVEREGTSGENIPETHQILKSLRRDLDAFAGHRIFLAEVNQWPEDMRAYFGDGDECQMAFHFPLMPRLYMALSRADRRPIVEILARTPSVPSNCQWAIFLRNHDELTLEMVTDEERDYLHNEYAKEPAMRINGGIRRRLAPLLGNDRRKLELLHGLLLSLPGTPVLYYGDEIGMGDNVFLGDRNGVRTPMQWTADENGGFSSAPSDSLCSPPIEFGHHGYRTLNVESQLQDPQSLIEWIRRMIAARRRSRAFGRGAMSIVDAGDERVLAFVREFETERMIVVVNLSPETLAVELPLPDVRLVDVTSLEALSREDDAPFLATLAPYAFHWFSGEALSAAQHHATVG